MLMIYLDSLRLLTVHEALGLPIKGLRAEIEDSSKYRATDKRDVDIRRVRKNLSCGCLIVEVEHRSIIDRIEAWASEIESCTQYSDKKFSYRHEYSKIYIYE